MCLRVLTCTKNSISSRSPGLVSNTSWGDVHTRLRAFCCDQAWTVIMRRAIWWCWEISNAFSQFFVLNAWWYFLYLKAILESLMLVPYLKTFPSHGHILPSPSYFLSNQVQVTLAWYIFRGLGSHSFLDIFHSNCPGVLSVIYLLLWPPLENQLSNSSMHLHIIPVYLR